MSGITTVAKDCQKKWLYLFLVIKTVIWCFVFSFQDRGKRLKLQQFIMKKATALFDNSLVEGDNDSQDKPVGEEGGFMNIFQQIYC